jgi:hypothetical protein
MTRLMGRAAWALLIVSVLVIGAAKGIGLFIPVSASDLLALHFSQTVDGCGRETIALFDPVRRVMLPVSQTYGYSDYYGQFEGFSWSPDGQTLIYAHHQDNSAACNAVQYSLRMLDLRTMQDYIIAECPFGCVGDWQGDFFHYRVDEDIEDKSFVFSPNQPTRSVDMTLLIQTPLYVCPYGGELSYAPDRSRFLCITQRGTYIGQGSQLDLLTTTPFSQPIWSPTGEWIASWNDHIIRFLHIDTLESHSLDAGSPPGEYSWIAWSPDGTLLAYTDWSRLSVFDIASKTLQQFDTTRSVRAAAWSSDGQYLGMVYYGDWFTTVSVLDAENSLSLRWIEHNEGDFGFGHVLEWLDNSDTMIQWIQSDTSNHRWPQRIINISSNQVAYDGYQSDTETTNGAMLDSWLTIINTDTLSGTTLFLRNTQTGEQNSILWLNPNLRLHDYAWRPRP